MHTYDAFATMLPIIFRCCYLGPDLMRLGSELRFCYEFQSIPCCSFKFGARFAVKGLLAQNLLCFVQLYLFGHRPEYSYFLYYKCILVKEHHPPS